MNAAADMRTLMRIVEAADHTLRHDEPKTFPIVDGHIPIHISALYEHIARSIGAIGVQPVRHGLPWGTDCMGGDGMIFQVEDNRVFLDAVVEGKTVFMTQISVENRGGGLGSAVMEAIRGFAAQHHCAVTVYKVSNPHFFSRLDWLAQTGVDVFKGKPSGEERAVLGTLPPINEAFDHPASIEGQGVDSSPVSPDEENDDTGPRTLRGVASFFRGAYGDDLDYQGPIDNAAGALRLVRENYLTGDCAAFAVAVHLRTGWPILAIKEKDAWHVFCRAPDGRFVDFSGYVTMDAMKRRYGFKKAVPKPITVKRALADDMGMLHYDPWHEVRVADFVISHLRRPPFNRMEPSKLPPVLDE